MYADTLDDAVGAIKRLQSMLGEVHDCDVWLEDLDAFARKLHKKLRKHFPQNGSFARLQVGLDYLKTQRARQRQQVFSQLVDSWRQWKRAGVWDRLVSVIGPPDQPHKVRKPPVQPWPSCGSPRRDVAVAAGHSFR